MSKFTKLMQGYLHLIEGKNEKIKLILVEQSPIFKWTPFLKPQHGYGSEVK